MKLTTISVWAMGVLLTTGLSNGVYGQEPASSFKHIESLEPFVGSWRAESGSPDDDGGFSMNARWAANKAYLQLQFSARRDDQRMHFGTMVVGQDVASNKLMMWGFWPDQQAHGEVTVGENKMTWTSSGSSTEGATSADASFSIADDVLTIAVTNAKRGGEERPDMTLTLNKRQRRRD